MRITITHKRDMKFAPGDKIHESDDHKMVVKVTKVLASTTLGGNSHSLMVTVVEAEIAVILI